MHREIYDVCVYVYIYIYMIMIIMILSIISIISVMLTITIAIVVRPPREFQRGACFARERRYPSRFLTALSKSEVGLGAGVTSREPTRV